MSRCECDGMRCSTAHACLRHHQPQSTHRLLAPLITKLTVWNGTSSARVPTEGPRRACAACFRVCYNNNTASGPPLSTKWLTPTAYLTYGAALITSIVKQAKWLDWAENEQARGAEEGSRSRKSAGKFDN
jgi:hypothetical protein